MISAILIAASLSLSSADDYYFVVTTNAPFAVTNIVGIGIGSSPEGTQAIRYEDVFFATEAFSERSKFGNTNAYKRIEIGSPIYHAGTLFAGNIRGSFSKISDSVQNGSLISNECEENFKTDEIIKINSQGDALASLIGRQSIGHWKYSPGDFPLFELFAQDGSLKVTNISRFVYGNLADFGIVSLERDAARAEMNELHSKNMLTHYFSWSIYSGEWVEYRNEENTNYTTRVDHDSFADKYIIYRYVTASKNTYSHLVPDESTGEVHLESKNTNEDSYNSIENRGVIYRTVNLLPGQSISNNGRYPTANILVRVEQFLNVKGSVDKINDGYYLVKANCFIEDNGRNLLVQVIPNSIWQSLKGLGYISDIGKDDLYNMINYPDPDTSGGSRKESASILTYVSFVDIIYLVRPTWRAREL